MELNRNQKKYIKKHIRNDSTSQIAQSLTLNEGDILGYLEKKWGKEKLDQFLKAPKKATVEKEAFGENRGWFSNNWLYLLILTVLVIGVFANSFDNAFVSDDIAEIRDNPNVGDAGTFLTHPYGFIRLIFYWVAFHIGGLNPPIFRLINIILHLGSVYLLYIVLAILHSKKLAFFAAAIFAIHPAISEAVVWISGGTYPQYTFFFLLSFLLYILSENKKFFYWLSVAIFLFTFMSHPVMPLPLFIIFPLYEYTYGNLRKNWFKFIPYFILSVMYVFINLGALPEREATLQSVHYQEKGIDNPLVQIPIAITSYLELIFWPKVLTLYHSELAFNNLQFFIRVVIFILLICGVFISLFKNKIIFFWLSLFFISLSPTLTPFRFNWIVAERYIYLPGIGFFVAILYFLEKFSTKKYQTFIYVAFILIIIALSTRTVIRNIDWHSEDNLWIATGKTSPSSPNTHNNLGDVYGRWGDKQRALQEFQTAIVLKPNYADAYHNLANTYLELADGEKAIENYKKAIEFSPKLWQSYQNIAAVYFQQKKYDLALDYIQKAISINSKNLILKSNLGFVYLSLGEKEKAKEIFSQVLSLDPQNQVAKQGLLETSK